jgi:hypothetical protein
MIAPVRINAMTEKNLATLENIVLATDLIMVNMVRLTYTNLY